MFKNIENSWYIKLKKELEKKYIKNLERIIHLERTKYTVYPPETYTFHALTLTPINQVKVVILGQDPYCFKNQAYGLAFSVPKTENIPPSLKNIYTELKSDIGIETPKHGCLDSWATQGILLLNSILTVKEGSPGSHANLGWEILTDCIIKLLSKSKKKIIFVLWGNYAMSKKKLLNHKRDIIIHSSHPSSLSASKSFFGSRPFSKINMHLKLLGKKEILWTL